MTVDCLVVGHLDTPLNELANRLVSDSGSYTEVRTNAIKMNGEYLSYCDYFNVMASSAYGMTLNLNTFDAPHAGAIYLTSRLLAAGISATALSFVDRNLDLLRTAMAEFAPKVVALTTTYYIDETPIRLLVRCLRKCNPNVFIVIGGPYVAARVGANSADSIPSTLGVDAVIVDSQGEQTLVNLVLGVTRARSNVDFVENLLLPASPTGVRRTPRRQELNRLGDNMVNWRALQPSLSLPLAFIRTARGCTFSCAFCNYPALSGEHQIADLDAVCGELEQLLELGVRDFAFVDDTFNVPLPRFKKLLSRMIERDYDCRWTSFFRCSNADDEAFDLMGKSGCQGVFLGIESGSAEQLKRMNKFANPKAYRRGIAKLRENGIGTMASFIIGFPGETSESIAETFDLIETSGTSYYNVQLYYHDRLAPVEAAREKFEIIGSGYRWEHRTMDWREGADWVETAMCEITGATPIPLYGFSIWSLPYFNAIGLGRDVFERFVNSSAEALRRGIEGEITSRDMIAQFREVVSPKLIASTARRLRPAVHDYSEQSAR